MNRRQFLHAGAAPLMAMNGKPRRVGLIGCGWYGKVDLLRLIQVAPVEVVSLCDVDRRAVEGAAAIVATRQKSGKTPRVYHDYREMLRPKDLDIVLIATPDHWHALAMIAAVKAGADVYVQKPISVDIIEAQAMLAAARKHGRVVQVGTQRRSTPHLKDAREQIVQAGKLGKIGLVEIYCYSPRPTQHPPDIPPPPELDYEFWTGPAPMRPFNPLIHPRGWRAFMEYGNGIMGDMGIHMLDMVRWMMNLGWPKTISSTGGILIHKGGKPNISDTQEAMFDFGDVKLVWQHRLWGQAPDKEYTWGATFYGERGTLKASVMRWDYLPIENGAQPIHRDVVYELDQYPEDRAEKDLELPVAPAVRYHMLDMLHAIDNRTRPIADIEQGYISTACCILANLSMKTGRSIEWDAATGRAVGDEELNHLLARRYRAPWKHPQPDSD
ncbi:MAG: Gfo/Idh/MocA family oxidoreductase [Bryobacterales bacterium]|nr:Gfo/Idh/MocA family oxidoreductase [Bryobacterales bacterium]